MILWMTAGLFLITVTDFSGAVDWPNFRGPSGSGVATESPFRSHWNADIHSGKTDGILWNIKVPGLGHSSPIVSGNRIFIATAVASDGNAPLQVGGGGRPEAANDNEEQRWMLLCYESRTGKELWRQTAHQGRPRATRHAKATHANSSIVVSGRHVIAFFGSEGLYCYDLDGRLKWKRDLGIVNISKYGIGWGYASSPAVHQGRIVVVCDDPKKPFMAALKLLDGSEIWRVSREGICVRNWSTPFVYSEADKPQVVVNGWPWIVSYDLQSGKEKWRLRGGGDNPVPTPFAANGWLYITSSHGGQSPIHVVRPQATGDITPAAGMTSSKNIVWTRQKGGSYMSTPVVYGDYLYLGNSNGVIRCFHAKTGDPVYEKRLGTNAGILSSLVAADGKIFCASENGIVYVLAAGPKYVVLARNKMGQACFASPAFSKGVMYFRTIERLIAIE